MRFEVGVDIVENSRFTPEVLEDKLFMEKYFTEREREYCFSQANPAQHFAARFAGKEAVVKALCGFGIRCRLWDVEIVSSDTGAPIVKLCDNLYDVNNLDVKISISHSDMSSIAFVMIASC